MQILVYSVVAFVMVVGMVWLLSWGMRAERPAPPRRPRPARRSARRRGTGIADMLGWTPTREEQRQQRGED